MSFGPYAYSNNGLSFRAVPAGYSPQSGEVVFTDIATTAQLQSAFSGYNAAMATKTAIAAGLATVANGINIESTGTSSLNAVYSCDAPATTNINAIISYILVNGTFPGGGTTMPWADMSGQIHVFPSVASFKNFATAVANYVATATLYADSGGAVGGLPATPVVIA